MGSLGLNPNRFFRLLSFFAAKGLVPGPQAETGTFSRKKQKMTKEGATGGITGFKSESVFSSSFVLCG